MSNFTSPKAKRTRKSLTKNSPKTFKNILKLKRNGSREISMKRKSFKIAILVGLFLMKEPKSNRRESAGYLNPLKISFLLIVLDSFEVAGFHTWPLKVLPKSSSHSTSKKFNTLLWVSITSSCNPFLKSFTSQIRPFLALSLSANLSPTLSHSTLSVFFSSFRP